MVLFGYYLVTGSYRSHKSGCGHSEYIKSYDDDVVRARFMSVAPISVRKYSKANIPRQIFQSFSHQPGRNSCLSCLGV